MTPRRAEGDNLKYWNHRVFVEDGVYTIREVYYGKKSKPTAYTEPEHPMGESIQELREDIWRMLMCLYSKPLTPKDFKRRKKPNNRKLSRGGN